MSATIRSVDAGDSASIAALHARCFQRGWSSQEFTALLEQDAVLAWAAEIGGGLAGFAMFRAAVDEAELLTVAVSPQARRAGVGSALLEHAVAHLRRSNITCCFLEVARNNFAAIELYRKFQFEVCGMRANYYAGPTGASGPRVDAMTMRLMLKS